MDQILCSSENDSYKYNKKYEKYRNDKDFVIESVKIWFYYLQFAYKKLLDNKKFVLKILKNNGGVCNFYLMNLKMIKKLFSKR